MAENPRTTPGSTARAVGAVGVGTLLSRLSGLLREQVFAILFGAGNMTDAYNIAFRIPAALRNLFAEGALSASIVPTFTRVRIEQGEDRAWRLAGLAFRLLTAIVGVIALLGILFAGPLVSTYAGAFRAIPGKFELTVRMTRIIFPYFPLVALSAAFMGVLNACGKYFFPAFSSALFNLVSVTVGVACVFWIERGGAGPGWQPIEGMAIGVLAGGLVQAFCQLPLLYRSGYRWKRKRSEEPAWYRDPALRQMMLLMVPGTVGLAATQVNVLVNTWMATTQGPGAVSWLNYAFRLMQFPIGLFGVSLASVTLTQISQQWVVGDIRAVEKTLSRTLKQVFAINLPASMGLAFLGFPIIELIFQYGNFTPGDARATATALAMYALGLTAYSVVKVLVPAFYALGKTRVPVIASLVTVAATTLWNLLLIRAFGFWGLALGTSAGAMLNSFILLYAAGKLIEAAGATWDRRGLLRSFSQNLLVALVMGIAVYYSAAGLESMIPTGLGLVRWGRISLVLLRAMRVGLLIVEGVAIVVVLAKILGLTESTEAIDLFANQLKKKLRPHPR